MDDEFEVSHQRPSPSQVRDPADDAARAASGLPTSDLSGKRSWKRRLRLLIGTASVGAIFLLIVTLGGAQGGGALLRALYPPTPVPLQPGQDTILLTHTVPWGTLRIDDRKMGVPPPASDQVPYPMVRLGRGMHSVVYMADPFPSLRCTLTVPPQPDDTCPKDSIRVTPAIENLGAVRVVDAQATPDFLPAERRSVLVAAIEASLALPAVGVRPGEHYRAHDGVHIAAAPLTATLLLPLKTDSRVYIGYGEVCLSVCPVGPERVFPQPSGWPVYAIVTPRWEFVEADGLVTPGGAVSDDFRDWAAIPLNVMWNGSWSVARRLDSWRELCTLPSDLMARISQAMGRPALIATYTSDNPAEGCLVVVTAANADGTPPSTPDATIDLLSHCGVLLAVNDTAHRALAELPEPGETERALARRFRALPPD